ncbi:meiosis inhibitor protein 1-like [Mercenaria mercenaria]|uniref:meiosis inhibitor protein 1-like n=1 Tax=Mercenaria mercenaria TaxID=6596 RepID=UPI00234E9C54|nr:meiosis inhibitor protein 1-like [Mercenaria mercenaria]
MKLHARTLQQVHSGILNMLSSARSLPVLINGLGLLKKLIADSAGCQSLMSLNREGVTLLTCMKKLLLSKKDVLQMAVSQILSLVLKKENYLAYATTILESDIVEFLFESLHTENTLQIECILKVLQRLSNVEQFYKRCHSVYGVESVLRAVSTSIELKNPTLLSHGYSLLADILNRHPEDIPLFLSSSVVQKCLSLIQEGLGPFTKNLSFSK